MTQMMVTAYRINAKDVPQETVCRMVGEEVAEQIRRDAVRDVQGKLERARVIEDKYRAMMPEHEAQVLRRAKRKPLLRRILAPVETAWAFVYGCGAVAGGDRRSAGESRGAQGPDQARGGLMRSEDWPCREGGKVCEARQPGCQDKCLKMLAAQLCAGQERKAEKVAKRKTNDVVGMLTEDAIRRRRRKPRQK